MIPLVLDATALGALATRQAGEKHSNVHNSLRAALAEGADVLIPAAVLAELYRGGGHDQAVDTTLNRYSALMVVSTDRALARTVGHLLARAGRGSADHVDATVVATAPATGALILTGDPDDLTALAAPFGNIRIEGV